MTFALRSKSPVSRLGFVCFVVINPCVLSANRVDFAVLFHNKKGAVSNVVIEEKWEHAAFKSICTLKAARSHLSSVTTLKTVLENTLINTIYGHEKENTIKKGGVPYKNNIIYHKKR